MIKVRKIKNLSLSEGALQKSMHYSLVGDRFPELFLIIFFTTESTTTFTLITFSK